jgi:hypothetical protein
MRSKVSRRAVVGGVSAMPAASAVAMPAFAAMNTAAQPVSESAGVYGRWSPAELQAANEETERLMREAFRRLEARGASATLGGWSPAELRAGGPRRVLCRAVDSECRGRT